jgi:hypothetical protein
MFPASSSHVARHLLKFDPEVSGLTSGLNEKTQRIV